MFAPSRYPFGALAPHTRLWGALSRTTVGLHIFWAPSVRGRPNAQITTRSTRREEGDVLTESCRATVPRMGKEKSRVERRTRWNKKNNMRKPSYKIGQRALDSHTTASAQRIETSSVSSQAHLALVTPTFNFIICRPRLFSPDKPRTSIEKKKIHRVVPRAVHMLRNAVPELESLPPSRHRRCFVYTWAL
jgi:hypothetical protein